MKTLNKIKFDLFYFIQAPALILIFSILIPFLILNIPAENAGKVAFLLLQILFLIIFYFFYKSHLISFLIFQKIKKKITNPHPLLFTCFAPKTPKKAPDRGVSFSRPNAPP